MKKYILLLLILALTAGMLAGCGSSGVPASQPVSEPPASADPPDGGASADVSDAGASGTRTVTDALGRVVEIPAAIERIVPLANTPRMLVYLGLADRVVGISGFDLELTTPLQAYAYANKDLWAGLPVVGTDASGATDYYPEQIIAADPDVILCTYTQELADEIQTKTGIPVVAVPMGTLFGEDYEAALRLLGEVCGASDRAEDVIAYINGCLDDLAARTAGVPDPEKPTALAAAATFKGPHGIEGVYSRYAVFEAVAARDVTAGISDKSGGVMVDKEQVLGWNPEIIFFDYSGLQLVKTDYAENPDYYAHLTAFQTGNIYQYPNSTYYYTNVEIPLVNCYFVAGILYPEQFGDIVFEDKAAEIFEFFLGDGDYLGKLEAYGAGYCKVEPGEA